MKSDWPVLTFLNPKSSMGLPIVQFFSADEKEVYTKYYNSLLPPGSSIFKFPSTPEVQKFFRLSKLPKHVLEKVKVVSSYNI